MMKLMLIGDSIRMHYGPRVARELAPDLDTWGPDENCGTSANVLANIDEWLARQRPDVVHLNCGLHDLRFDPGASAQLVPLQQYRSNLRQIFGLLEREERPRVIWATITPIDERRHRMSKASRRYEADVGAYNEAARDIALEHGARIDDLHGLVVAHGPLGLLGPDGVHFTEAGYALLARAVAASVRACLGATA